MALVSQQGFAKKVGVSRQRINVLVKSGVLKPALAKIPGKKFLLLDEDLALSILNKSLDPSKKRDGQTTSEYHSAKAAEIRAKVEKIQFENEIRKAKYILREEAERLTSIMLLAAREAFENAQIELCHSLASESDPAKLYAISGKILNRAFYQMKIASGIVEDLNTGIREDEIKKALALIDDAPVGKIAAGRLYEELLRAISDAVIIFDDEDDSGETEPSDWDVKNPGRYDSPFQHDPIVLDTYAIFCRLRRSLIEVAPETSGILNCLYIRLKTLRLEIRNRIIEEPEKIGDLYKELLQSGAKHIKLEEEELLNE